MTETLTGEELVAMVERVFQPTSEDHALAILVDLPDSEAPDTSAWRQRREMATDWARRLTDEQDLLGMQVHLVLYRNPRMNNADLPDRAWLHREGPLPATADELDAADATPFAEVFGAHRVLVAPTQFSATAPLKLAAREFGFRAATMPGFSPEMIPALRLDYAEINRRVLYMKDLLDRATGADLTFEVDRARTLGLQLDLRHRTAHASGGLFPDPGVAGNLPSGETYIVPYEGEQGPSRSQGKLPVQFEDEVVVYDIENNLAVRVEEGGAMATAEAARLVTEPAYGNMAELGLGVLADFGVEPSGEILLDEKLGLHIAFGRSDHFGGQVGASRFSRPEAVVHIDRVYIPRIQPRISVREVVLTMDDQRRLPLIRDDRYVIDFGQASAQ